MYFENGGGLQEAKSVYSEPPSLIDDISGKLRNVQSVPFESVCAGDQSLNCGQNGKCVSLPTVENQKQFVCICSDGFTGPTCETARMPTHTTPASAPLDLLEVIARLRTTSVLLITPAKTEGNAHTSETTYPFSARAPPDTPETTARSPLSTESEELELSSIPDKSS
ncbi:EGF domain-containing membrane associated protein [Cryptosporidium canis]|nr:EGF domain-containing membrane associated protein [Cryptosporidium canis]